MKIGILTFPNSRSYGASLQMFALYFSCQRLGYDAEIINYYNLWMKQEKHMSIGQEKNAVVSLAKRKVYDLIHVGMKLQFAQFEKRMHKYPKKPTADPKQLQTIANRYGAVICGSDQVWNPDITNKDLSFFLDFCLDKTKRISYAPSFGVEDLKAPYADAVTKALKKIDFLSVREEAGKSLIKKLSGLDSKIVVDPTFLLDGKQWQTYEKSHPQAAGEYILYFTVHNSKKLWKYCMDLARKTNMKILRVGSNIISKQFKKQKGMEYVCDIGPAQWLYLVRNASYVMTNSFHGTAFSIIFRKNFFVEFSSLTNSRLSNIVKLMGLEARVLQGDREITPSATDYSKTEAVLPELISESVAFLETALKNSTLKQEQ